MATYLYKIYLSVDCDTKNRITKNLNDRYNKYYGYSYLSESSTLELMFKDDIDTEICIDARLLISNKNLDALVVWIEDKYRVSVINYSKQMVDGKHRKS